MNQDVSTGPLARPFTCSLTPLTRSLASDCSLRSRPPLRSLVRSLAHFAHSLARGKVNFWCLKMTWFCLIVRWLGCTCLPFEIVYPCTWKQFKIVFIPEFARPLTDCADNQWYINSTRSLLRNCQHTFFFCFSSVKIFFEYLPFFCFCYGSAFDSQQQLNLYLAIAWAPFSLSYTIIMRPGGDSMLPFFSRKGDVQSGQTDPAGRNASLQFSL